MKARNIVMTALGTLALCAQLLAATPAHRSTAAASAGYIVQAHGGASAARAVRRAGGHITHELPIINGVSALLNPAQVAQLRRNTHIDLFADTSVKTMGGPIIDQYARVEVGADKLGAQGFFGNGVTVAVLDSGVWYSWNNVKNDMNGNNKILAEYDAIASKVAHAPDDYGHGSHIASIIGSPDISINGEPQGIAPMAKLVSVKAFDVNGSSSYATVLNGLNWILANRATYNIRVLNLSFGAPPQSYYWNDPINQAVMKLWQAGVVVVVSAGNSGPAEQTINV
ncbi:MAG: S8 family serine peptidase, partial [Steroidobacteraceae bacterium]